MKVISPNLRKLMESRNISISEMTRRVNKLRQLTGYSKRPMTRQSLYDYFSGISAPSADKVYVISAILKKEPHKIFRLEFDKTLYQKYLDFLSKI